MALAAAICRHGNKLFSRRTQVSTLDVVRPRRPRTSVALVTFCDLCRPHICFTSVLDTVICPLASRPQHRGSRRF